MVKRSLLSVSDKTGIVDLARGLAKLGIEIISTGGTAKIIRDAGIEVRVGVQLFFDLLIELKPIRQPLETGIITCARS